MGAREYDPSLGRWLSADTIVPGPANPQSLNRYSYVYNNPCKYIDPSGHVGVCFNGGPRPGDADEDNKTTLGQLCDELGAEGLLGEEWVIYNNRVKDIKKAYKFIMEELERAAEEGRDEPVVIVGYSYGGAAALELVDMLNQLKTYIDLPLVPDFVIAYGRDDPTHVDVLVTLDPFTKGRLQVRGDNPYVTSKVSSNVGRAYNVYAGAQDIVVMEGIENLQGAMNVEGVDSKGNEATHTTLMTTEEGNLNPKTLHKVMFLMGYTKRVK